jgi:hypothetical protein
MSLRFLGRLASAAVATLVVLGGCKGESSSTPIPNTANHLALVSPDSAQMGAVSAVLPKPLVVEMEDGANRPVAGAAITWTVTGGGSVSAATGTTDAAGLDSVTWTLASTPGVQTVTATSTAVPTASVGFVASNGPTILGSVTSTTPPQGMLSATVARARTGTHATASASMVRATHPRRTVRDLVVVGFRNDRLHVDAAGSQSYRSMDVARSTATLLETRATAMMQRLPMTEAEVSPAILAVRFRVLDSTKVDSVIAALQTDSTVAWVTREGVASAWNTTNLHTMPPSARQRSVSPTSVTTTSTATKLSGAEYWYTQYWGHNMVDLPRAWAITTGSPSVIVAVVDMGIRADNPDITANLTSDGYDFVSAAPVTEFGYTSPQSICLPDGSGTVIGTFTTFAEDAGPHANPNDPDDLAFDPYGFNCWDRAGEGIYAGDHGLWTAGIIGATGTATAAVSKPFSVGYQGVNWNVKIRPVRVLDVSGEGEYFDIAQGILYAAGLPANSGGCKLASPVVGGGGCLDRAATSTTLVQTTQAPIINMSFGGGNDPTMEAAVVAASNAGSLLVASAANSSSSDFEYPAGYSATVANVMGVAAVGPSGNIASYSNDGLDVSVAAPGGDFQLDDNDNGGGGIWNAGWDFVDSVPQPFIADGTSASAPYVSGIAALLLAQTPGLSAATLASRIEQYAIRTANTQRNDTFGWGIADAYNALTQQFGPVKQQYARLLNATTGAAVSQVAVTSSGTFTFTQLQPGSYFLQAGEDEAGDQTIGIPGRRFGWAGSVASPTAFTITAGQTQLQSAAIAIGLPQESEPNGTTATANSISVGGYAVGLLTTPNVQDVYKVIIPTAGVYTFETSGVIGSCGAGIEMDTFLTLQSSAGLTLGSNDNELTGSVTGPYCSKVSMTLQPGTYYAIITGTAASDWASHGQYRLQVRSGP